MASYPPAETDTSQEGDVDAPRLVTFFATCYEPGKGGRSRSHSGTLKIVVPSDVAPCLCLLRKRLNHIVRRSARTFRDIHSCLVFPLAFS